MLDQYFMKFPHKLSKGPIECCHVDPINDQNLLHDEKHFGPGLEGAMVGLKNKGCLSTDMLRDCAARIWTYIGHEISPSSTVNIRSMETEGYKVIDKIKDEILEEIEESKAFFQNSVTSIVDHNQVSAKSLHKTSKGQLQNIQDNNANDAFESCPGATTSSSAVTKPLNRVSLRLSFYNTPPVASQT